MRAGTGNARSSAGLNDGLTGIGDTTGLSSPRLRNPDTSVPLSLRPLTPLWRCLALLAVAGSTAHAQRVLGATDDATVLPRGMLRVTISPTWNRFHERFADGLGVASRGSRESVAADVARDSLGPDRFPLLLPLQGGLQGLLGTTTGLPISLGRIDARYDATITRTPITVEYGLTRRIALGVVLPIVTTRTEVSLVPNPGGVTGTVGLNPGFSNPTAQGTNLAVLTQLTSATQLLQQALQTCVGSMAASCTAINADRNRAQALVQGANATAAGLLAVYGVASDRRGNRFAPVAGSALHTLVGTRLTTLATDFATFLGAPTGGSSWIAGRPVGAPPIGYQDFQQILTDPAIGIAGDSLRSVQQRQFGDIEVGAKFVLLDAFGGRAPQTVVPSGLRARVAVGGTYRLATGLRDTVDNFADLASGDGQSDLEGRVFIDLLAGRRFWASVVARYALQQSDELTLRVPRAPHEPFPVAASKVLLRRNLGDAFSADVSPRWVLNDNLSFAGTWSFYRKGTDSYATTVAGTDPSVLSLGTEQSWQRASLSLTYSTMAQYFQKRARTPMEVTISGGRTVSGRDGAPAQSVTMISMRVYNQLFQ